MISKDLPLALPFCDCHITQSLSDASLLSRKSYTFVLGTSCVNDHNTLLNVNSLLF